MAESAELQNIWPDFVKSDQFKDIKDYPQDKLQEKIESLFDLMGFFNKGSIKNWQLNKLQLSTVTMLESTKSDGSLEENEEKFANFAGLKSFLKFIGNDSRFGCSQSEMDILVNYLADYEDIEKLKATILEQEATEKDKNQKNIVDELLTYMPMNEEKYESDSECEINEKILKTAQKWLDEYVDSPDWKNRPKGVTVKNLTNAMLILTNFAYVDYRTTPSEWTEDSVQNTLLGRVINDDYFEQADYKLLVPALSEFLKYVSSRGWIAKDKIDKYQQYLTEIKPFVIKSSEDMNTRALNREATYLGFDVVDDDERYQMITYLDEEGRLDDFF